MADRSLRVEDRALLTGAACFVDDLLLDGMVEATFIRSPEAHATVGGFDLESVRDADGVFIAVTAEHLDLAHERLPVINQHPGLRAAVGPPLLGGPRVRYVGEPLAMVVARDRYLAEDAAELHQVRYQNLTPVVEAPAALAPGAAQVHDEAAGNVCGDYVQEVGDVDDAMATAPNRLHLDLRIDRGSAQPMETRGVIARWSEAGELCVWSNTQRPHGLQKVLAEYFELPTTAVRVISPDTGGAFGSKAYYTNEELLVAWAARALDRPVKWIEDRSEHFLATFPEHAQHFDVDAGFGDDGVLHALQVEFVHDLGAYAPYGFAIAQNTLNHLFGTYVVTAARTSFVGVYTNKTPSAAYRGAGRPQGVFVIERVMDGIADALGMDRIEVRRRNLVPAEAMPYDTGLRTPIGDLVYDSGDFASAMDDALADHEAWIAQRDELRKAGRLVGIGVANYVECSVTRPWESARLLLDTDGTFVLQVGVSSQGQGHQTSLAAVVSRALGVAADVVVVRGGDTELVPDAIGTFGSRVAIMAGNAAALAAGLLRDAAVELAGDALGLPASDLEWCGVGVRRRGETEPALNRKELASLVTAGEALDVLATYDGDTTHIASGTHAAMIEVDPDTAAVRVLHYAIAHDCGALLDERIVDGQVVGALVQGLGGCFLEQLVYDETGQLRSGSFLDYLLPTAHDVPADLRLTHLDSKTRANPLGVKGAGEGGVLPVYALAASALEDAIGARVDHMPVSPAELHELMAAAQ